MKKADSIFINGCIYTVDDKLPWATAMVIRDGKFVYVGEDAGTKDYEGPVVDLQGQFVMPGLIESHCHIAMGSEALLDRWDTIITGTNKTEVLESIKQAVAEKPGNDCYRFMMRVASLDGEKLCREELDAICPDKPLLIVEMEQHSRWLNSLEMKKEHIAEDMPDIIPDLSYCERDADGKINGRIFEWCGMSNTYTDFSKEVYSDGLNRIMEYWKKWGVVAAFDAGQPSNAASIDKFFTNIMEQDRSGNMPLYIEGCYFIYNPAQLESAIENLKEYDKNYCSEHLRARTMKIMMDGTMNGHTAALTENYADTDTSGNTLLDLDTLTKFVIALNENGIDLHVHSIGDRSIALVLDAVENAQKQLGDQWKIQVTCAHVEWVRPEDFGRFAKLGVLTNFTPSWFGGNCYDSYDAMVKLLGEKRASATHRAGTIMNTGATVSFSSDSISLLWPDLTWCPYIGLETGITRQTPVDDDSVAPMIPSSSDRLSLAQMIKGYTINSAIQMKLDDKIGSIEAGKDASFLVFEKSLFDLDPHQIHTQLPREFYIRGIRQ